MSFLKKYIYISAAFLLLTAVSTAVFSTDLSAHHFITTPLFLFIILVYFFLKREIVYPLKSAGDFARKTAEAESSDADNNFSQKIEAVQNIIFELEVKKIHYPNKETSELYSSLIKLANRMLSELETAKRFKVNRNDFLGNVTHELRTPIFAIQLSLETLIEGAIHDENVNMDFLRKAFNQSTRLKELVDDLINISKLETNMRMSKRYFAINDFIKETIEELKDLAESKNVTIAFKTNGINGVNVFGDIERIKQVMVNLIDNAIKYTPEGGTITISTTVKDKEVLISVADTGIGIPEKDLPRVFERFYRVDKARSRDIGGSGLGLSIVKHIIEAHGSTISVKSEENKGTAFEFALKK